MAEAESSILIVDDDPDDLSALKEALDSLGCILHTVTDPHDVLPAVYREQPDVVVLDALLPGLSGFDLCKQIKTDSELKGTRVVIITGVYLRQQYRQEALQQFKADGFLTKPFRAPELQRLVVELLTKKTRKPQSSKRGLFGRFFGEQEEAEPTPARIEPVSRARSGEIPKSRYGKVPSPEPDSVETMPDTAVPAVTVTEPRNETDTAPAAQASPQLSEVGDAEEVEAATPQEPIATDEPATTAAADEDSHAEEKASESKVQEPVETAPASDDPIRNGEATRKVDDITFPKAWGSVWTAREPEAAEAEPSVSDEPAADAAATQDEKAEEKPEPGESSQSDAPRAGEPVDATPASEATGGVDESASSKSSATRAEQGLDATPAADEPAADEAESEALPKAEEETVAATAEADKDPSRVEKPKPDAAASPLPVQRPTFRVGDVPIYDEEDFYSELKRELSKCRRVDRPLTLILIQVDDLTQIVELFGKEIREAVLWHVAEQAMAAVREIDLVGMMSSKDLIALTAFASDRYGGGRVVARMRKLLEKNPFRVGEELPPIVPALQFGISSFPDDGDEVVALIAKAYKEIEH